MSPTYLRMGDIAHCDDDGFFYIDGRIKDMYISGGVNAYPAEVARRWKKRQWGQVGAAFVIGRTTEVELGHFLQHRLARYKLPRTYYFVESLPRTPYGKIVKPELRKWIQEGLS